MQRVQVFHNACCSSVAQGLRLLPPGSARKKFGADKPSCKGAPGHECLQLTSRPGRGPGMRHWRFLAGTGGAAGAAECIGQSCRWPILLGEAWCLPCAGPAWLVPYQPCRRPCQPPHRLKQPRACCPASGAPAAAHHALKRQLDAWCSSERRASSSLHVGQPIPVEAAVQWSNTSDVSPQRWPAALAAH